MKFRRGDEVRVTIGKDRGKTGKIEKVFPKMAEVLVAGVNMYKRHMKPRDPRRPAGIIDIVKPLSVGKIVLICPSCKQPTRVGFQLIDNTKVRVCRKCESRLTR